MKSFLKDCALALVAVALFLLALSDVQDRDERIAEQAQKAHAVEWDELERAADKLISFDQVKK